MAEVSISLVTIISVIAGAVLGAVVTLFMRRKVNGDDFNSMQTRAENAEALNSKISSSVAELESQIVRLKAELAESSMREHELQAEKIKFDATKMKEIEAERKLAYESGMNDALKDYKIVYTPFIYKDGMVFKNAKGGYRFQFCVKGIPAFQPIDVIISEESGWDEDVKQTLINVVNQAVAIAGKQWGGIPFEMLPVVNKLPEIK